MNEQRYTIVERACCGSCIHYRQHYVLRENGQPFPVWYGHCRFPRLKRRTPDETCPHWESAERDLSMQQKNLPDK